MTHHHSGFRRKITIGNTRLGACGAAALLGLALVASGSCSSVFNPSFLALISTPTPDETGAVPNFSISNAPGHVPVVFVNNTRFDDNLLDYMRSIGVNVDQPNLRPRIRVRTTIEYVNGGTNVIEFIDGSALVQGSVVTEDGIQQNLLVPTDLTENDLTNIVAICDVSRVAPGVQADNQTVTVEVFVPVFLKTIRIVEQDLIVQRELVSTTPPQFSVLQPDTVDANNNITLLQNFDIRDIPVAATNLQCGSVVGFSISGTLSVPFVNDELDQNVPGFLDTDNLSQAASPGRFEFMTTVR